MKRFRDRLQTGYGFRSGMMLAGISLVLMFTIHMARAQETDKITFVIHSFLIEGNTLLDKELLSKAVRKYTGGGKSAEDVELARDAIERLYHKLGYPTVLVNIPEQTVDDGIIRLQVIESTIKRVHVVGNKYYTMEHIKEKLPSIEPGKILYLPKVREELSALNRNPDLKVSPLLIPGRELGTINVELKAQDKLPFHGSLEVNNRSTHTTTDTRVNAMLRYDNLWQRGHSISAQFQTAPENTDEVMVYSCSYSLPALWAKNHLMIGYYIDSDSQTASGEGFNVIGEGRIVGFRYLVPLPSMTGYDHNLTFGFDWKDFKEDIESDIVPVEYLPLSIGYASSQRNNSGVTQYSADINFLLRDLFMNHMDEFQAKRAGSTGNYIYLTAGVERRHKLPKDWSLFVKLDGQLADQPLINNEQYAAGGVTSLRGYKESEILADNAIHSTIELFAPSLVKKHVLIPYIFYDCAWLATREALPDEYGRIFIHGAGLGLTGKWNDTLSFKLDWGVALKTTDDTESGDHELHFKVNYQF